MSEEEYIEFSAYELEAIRAGIKEELFETKKYALQKAPIMTLFSRKISRLNDLIDVQKDLFPEDINESFQEITLTAYNTNKIADLFIIYFANKNKLKHDFSATSSLHEAIDLMKKMCANEKDFGRLFEFLEVPEDSVVSKEPDPMDIQIFIKELAKKQLFTLENVKNNTIEVPSSLLNEMKRLSLLAKKY